LQNLLDIIFELCYYAGQQWNDVMDMYTFDIEWMQGKLLETKKKELKGRQQ
jgi:hypothetical protein